MVAVRMVQVAVDQIVDVIAVRHGFMAASRPVHVVGSMAGALVVRGAAIGVSLRNFDDVLIDVVAMRMLQVTVLQIIDVVAVVDGRVPALGAVLMSLPGWYRHIGLR